MKKLTKDERNLKKDIVLPDDFWDKLHDFSLKYEQKRMERELKIEKARNLLDQGKIKLSEYLEIINQ